MLDVQEALAVLVLSDATLTELIADRYRPGTLEAGSEYPAIAYESDDIDQDDMLATETRGSSGLAHTKMRFFCGAKGNGPAAKATSRRVALALRNCLQGFRGEVSDGQSPEDTLFIDGIFRRGGFDGYDDTTKTYQFVVDYIVGAKEERPPAL